MEMEDLRRSVVGLVRSATAEVDRRLNERFRVDLGCRVTVDGRTEVARVVDWSDTGAQIRGAAAMQPDQRGTLDIDGVGFPLPFSVKHADSGTLNVAFVLDEATAVRFGGMPARLAVRQAA